MPHSVDFGHNRPGASTTLYLRSNTRLNYTLIERVFHGDSEKSSLSCGSGGQRRWRGSGVAQKWVKNLRYNTHLEKCSLNRGFFSLFKNPSLSYQSREKSQLRPVLNSFCCHALICASWQRRFHEFLTRTSRVCFDFFSLFK